MISRDCWFLQMVFIVRIQMSVVCVNFRCFPPQQLCDREFLHRQRVSKIPVRAVYILGVQTFLLHTWKREKRSHFHLFCGTCGSGWWSEKLSLSQNVQRLHSPVSLAWWISWVAKTHFRSKQWFVSEDELVLMYLLKALIADFIPARELQCWWHY